MLTLCGRGRLINRLDDILLYKACGRLLVD
jgi:hypothetical protein